MLEQKNVAALAVFDPEIAATPGNRVTVVTCRDCTTPVICHSFVPAVLERETPQNRTAKASWNQPFIRGTFQPSRFRTRRADSEFQVAIVFFAPKAVRGESGFGNASTSKDQKTRTSWTNSHPPPPRSKPRSFNCSLHQEHNQLVYWRQELWRGEALTCPPKKKMQWLVPPDSEPQFQA